MTESDIIAKWIEMGWRNADDYHSSIKNNKIIIDEFHPDKVNLKNFWEAADEHFETDPIANSNIKNSLMTITESNWNNHKIAKNIGLINQLEFCIDYLNHLKKAINIAEIGCGYGSLYYNFITRNGLNYTGFDLFKRFEAAKDIEGYDWTFSYQQELKHKNEFTIFYSSNTFQHLSPRQIEKYLHQVYDMLPYSGLFVLMYVFDIDNTYHYGQQVKIIEENKFLDLIKSVGFGILHQSKQFVGHIKPMTVTLVK